MHLSVPALHQNFVKPLDWNVLYFFSIIYDLKPLILKTKLRAQVHRTVMAKLFAVADWTIAHAVFGALGDAYQ